MNTEGVVASVHAARGSLNGVVHSLSFLLTYGQPKLFFSFSICCFSSLGFITPHFLSLSVQSLSVFVFPSSTWDQWVTGIAQSVYRLITGWTVRRSNPGESDIFRTSLHQPCSTPSLLYNRSRVSFPGVKRPGRGGHHPHASSAEVQERVEIYLYSPSGRSWPVLGRNWPFCTFTWGQGKRHHSDQSTSSTQGMCFDSRQVQSFHTTDFTV
jgi:hypothetical protein